ncbi:hypothetical protein BT69DRAFT_1304730 [Atractiella rhizophila]|nr:hypothetical protein BT69DRAFT_1304730 [Atractiella rhizophila]
MQPSCLLLRTNVLSEQVPSRPAVEVKRRLSDVAGVKRKREEDDTFKLPPLPPSAAAAAPPTPSSLTAEADKAPESSFTQTNLQDMSIQTGGRFEDGVEGSRAEDGERPVKVRVVEDSAGERTAVPSSFQSQVGAVAGGRDGAEKKEENKKLKLRLKPTKLDPLSTLSFPPSLASLTFANPPPLLPPPPRSVAPTPYPSSQSKVNIDFTVSGHKPSQGTQVPFSSFAANVELYLRPFGQDDLGLLSSSPSSAELESFAMPPKGEHYLKVWGLADAEPEPGGLRKGVMRREWMSERAFGEERGLEEWTERAVGAVIGDWKAGLEGVRREARPNVNPGLPQINVSLAPGGKKNVRFGKTAPSLGGSVADKSLKAELAVLGLLDEEDGVGGSGQGREDDEISIALRLAQDALRKQSDINEHRKSVLFSRVKDRLAYQDYQTLLDGCDTIIEAAFKARMRQLKRERAPKDRDRRGTRLSRREEGEKIPGLGEVDDEALVAALRKRREVMEKLGPLFAQKDGEGRWRGIPRESVYKGIKGLEEDVTAG